ncbi:MAG: hypothetical protein WA092_01165 [Minisyncoccales bacterium]
MQMSLKIKYAFLILMFGFIFSLPAEAATLELGLEKDITSPNDDVIVLVTINSDGQDVNTAQATISFPANLLEVTKIDRINSVFSFWLEEPSYDNGRGSISFVGGSTSGFSGASLKVMQVSFRVKGSGTGRLGVTNAAITASDGTGSNVYTTAKGLDIDIPATSEFESVILEKEKTDATIASILPAQIIPTVSFYSDPTKWNNRSASFQASWNIGSDVIMVGEALNQIANFIPEARADALLGSKIFPALDDGVWYLHLRASNNIGWGPTSHYRLAIDTMPPNSFEITSDSTFKTNNPKPTINFVSSDLVSGIKNYTISLDGSIIATVSSSRFTFEPLLPGTYRLVVMATDNAGNSTSQTETLEILPIESPQITYVSRKVIIEEEGITAGGIALSDTEVIIQVQNSKEQIVDEQTIPVDGSGAWNIVINKELKSGDYYLLVRARDKNMASSFLVVSEVIKVRPHPVLTLGSLEVNQTWFFIILIIILVSSFSFGWYSNYRWRQKLDQRAIIAQRDVINVFENLRNDINKLLKSFSDGTISKGEESEIVYILKIMLERLEKANRYIVDNIRKINK